MRLVLDASAIIGSSFNLASPDFQALLSKAKELNIEIVIIDVVLDEIVNHAKENLDAKATKANEASKAYAASVGRSASLISEQQISEDVTAHRQRILAEFESAGAMIVRHTPVDHSVLVTRDIQKKKPFGGGKSSYRDALIWFTILDMLRANPEKLVLVSSNSNDFSDPKTDADGPYLHPHLGQDLGQLQLPADSVMLLTDLASVVSRYVSPGLPNEQDFAEMLRANTFEGLDLIQEVSTIVEEFMIDLNYTVEPSAFGFTDDVWSLRYDSSMGTELIESVTVRRIDTALVLVEVDLTFTADFEAEIDRRSALAWDDDATIDFNEGTATTSVDAKLRARIRMTIDTDSNEVRSSAMVGLDALESEIEYVGSSSEELKKDIVDASKYLLR